MSLEIALAENTATMKQLIELLKGGIPAAEEPKKTRKPRGEAPPEPEAPAAAAPAAPEPPAAPAVEYKAVADAITRLVAKDRAAAVEILAGFGVKRGPDLKPEQWADALAQLKTALA